MSNLSEKISVYDGINNFFQKNRKAVFIFCGAVLVFLVVFIAALGVLGVLRNRAINGVEELNRRYEALRFDIAETSKESEVTELLQELTGFAEKNSGYAGGRAWSIIGSIYADKKEWQEAEKAYARAAKAAAKTYIAPTAYFNAAAAAEEQGNITGAIDFYTQCVSLSALFPAAARAQFAIGRLWEKQNDKAAALEAYRGLISGWPADSVWTNLAHNRIIILEQSAQNEETGQ